VCVFVVLARFWHGLFLDFGTGLLDTIALFQFGDLWPGEGNAIQLATYGALVGGYAPYRAGYYLLNQRQFATLAASGLVGRPVEGARSFPQTWEAIVDGWRLWRAAADAGMILALGVDGYDDHLPDGLTITREVRCDWCDYSTLCRVRGLA